MKYFCVSDIHSFYTPLKEALKQAGFRKSNKDHCLVVCGDVFDRGEETIQVYQFLKSLPKNRCILIKGNHESLYFDLLKKSWPDDYDYSNGTVKTFCAIAGVDEQFLSADYYYANGMGDGWRDRLKRQWLEIKKSVEESSITKWLKSDQWKDYWEYKNFIFVHSFIPVVDNDGLPGYYINNRHFSPMKNWREDASQSDWEDARWGCPWKQYKQGLFDLEKAYNKVLVCGHWHTDDFWSNLDHIYDSLSELYYSKNLIGLDGGVHYEYQTEIIGGKFSYKKILVHEQNVLVIDGEKYFDKYGAEIKLEDRNIENQ